MAEVKLFGTWFSPFVRRVEMALKLKGVEYEFVDEDLKNKSPLLLKYNPVHKKVPLLLHNGKPIAKSMIIIEYIDECMTALWKACWSTGEQQEKAKEETTEVLKFLDNEIKDKKFFGGDNIGLVDISANFIAYWFRIFEELIGLKLLTEDKFPNLCKWADEYCSNSFVKENKLVASFASFKAAFQTAACIKSKH